MFTRMRVCMAMHVQVGKAMRVTVGVCVRTVTQGLSAATGVWALRVVLCRGLLTPCSAQQYQPLDGEGGLGNTFNLLCLVILGAGL